jgi:FSR family fosmidomycin resistance protein-like MFS transporter
MTTLTARRATLTGMNLTLLLTLAHSINDAFTNVLPVFLPTLQLRFGVGEAALAVLVAIVSLSANVLQPFVGAFADHWGRRRAAALGIMAASVLMSFVAVAPNFWSLVFILAVGGLGSAVFHPAAASMARNTGAPKSLSMSFFAAGGGIGTAIMPVVVLSVIRSYGIQYVPFLAIVGVLFGLALFLFTPRQAQPTTTARPRAFDLALFTGPVGLLATVGIFRAVAFISFTNAMPLYLVSVRGYAADAGILGWTLTFYSAASAFGGVLAGLSEPYLGRRPIIVGSMLLAIPALAATLLLPAGTVGYFIAVILSGMLPNCSIPLLVVSAQDLAPHAVATASGMLMGFTWGIAGVLYIGFGSLQELIGLVPAISAGFAFLLPAALLAHRVLKRNEAAQARSV